jgi:hypothetical protein
LLGGRDILCHIDFKVFKGSPLSDLPVNCTNICALVCPRNINLEIAYTAKEIVYVDVPFFLISNINIGSNDTQTNKAAYSENCGKFERLLN